MIGPPYASLPSLRLVWKLSCETTRPSKPAPTIKKNAAPLTSPPRTLSSGPLNRVCAISDAHDVKPISYFKTLPVPSGMTPTANSEPAAPAATARIVPSPPAAITASTDFVMASVRTCAVASADEAVSSISTVAPAASSRSMTRFNRCGRATPAEALNTRAKRRRISSNSRQQNGRWMIHRPQSARTLRLVRQACRVRFRR